MKKTIELKKYEELIVERNTNGVKAVLMEEFIKECGLINDWDDWLNMTGKYARTDKSKPR